MSKIFKLYFFLYIYYYFFISMPIMTGPEASKILCEEMNIKQIPIIPIIACTAH